MKRLLFSACVALLFPASPLLANPYEDGVARMRMGDYGGAMNIWRERADDDPRLQYAIGYLLQYGLGVEADPQKAMEWYEKAGERKYGDAWYAIGLMWEDAKLGPRNLANAMIFYRKAAAEGPNPAAEYAIGRMYLRGRGVEPDPVEAVKWLKLSAEHGSPAGQYNLASAFEAGSGVKPDREEALFWYMMAARNDRLELMDNDMGFQPDLAIETLKRSMPAAAVKKAEARVLEKLGPSPKPPAEAAAPGAAAKSEAPAPQPEQPPLSPSPESSTARAPFPPALP